MKSSSGQYFIGLDHIRALAALIVFSWHFIHVNNGQYAPPPLFPLSILTEGHTGVALFMALSGYLFAKLLDDKEIIFISFIWNRLLRLLPLLCVVIIIFGIQQYFANASMLSYAKRILTGLIEPSLPNGGWSITAEFHFYLLLPALLFLTRTWKYSLIVIILLAILIRIFLHHKFGQVQTLSYYTIIGRIDQFLFGILAYQFRNRIAGKHLFIIAVLLMFATFYWYFDALGGFYKFPSYPSPSTLWIYIPTIEGFAYAVIIAWYDNSFTHTQGKISRFIARIGTYSYSIYLLHFFIVFNLAHFIDHYVINLSNIYLSLLFSLLGFFVMIPIGYISYRFIELPFLRFRTQYILSKK